VKIVDLEDNMDVTRLDSVDAELGERLERYHRSWNRLTAVEWLDIIAVVWESTEDQDEYLGAGLWSGSIIQKGVPLSQKDS